MTLKVNPELSATENLFALVQHTWPQHAEILTDEHITIVGGQAVDGDDTVLQATITGTSERVIGAKTVEYAATDVSTLVSSEGEALDFEAAHDLVVAQLDGDLPCLRSEIEVSEAVSIDGQFRVTVSAVEGAVTCFGEATVWVGLAALDLENDLPGETLDGFEQVTAE